MTAPGQPTPGRVILLMLGSAAITVAVLLPVYLLDRQATRLAIAKLEIELAHARASAPTPPAASAPVALPAPASAAPVPVSAPVPAAAASAPSSRGAEMAQVTRALTDLARRVDGLVGAGDTPRPVQPDGDEPPARASVARSPVDTRDVETVAAPVRLTDVRIRVFYEVRCLGLAVDVAERLLALGADPELIETRQTTSGVSRLSYMGIDQAPVAAALVDGLSSIVPVDVQLDTSGVAANGLRLQLAGAAGCQRPR